MFIDAQNRFSNEQALSATAVSDDVIDTKVDGNLGVGEPMACVVTLKEEAVDGGGAETYVAKLESSSDEAFTAPIELSSISIPAGSAAGSKFVLPVPADSRADRYFRVSYVLGGTAPTATVTSFLIPQSMVQNDYVFPHGYKIS
jgi:hypothetical protein